MEFEKQINGKRVKLKERLPLRDGRRLPELMQACTSDLGTQVPVLVLVVESWEFPGNPADPAAYEDLDIYTEVLPLANWAGEHLRERLAINSKN